MKSQDSLPRLGRVGLFVMFWIITSRERCQRFWCDNFLLISSHPFSSTKILKLLRKIWESWKFLDIPIRILLYQISHTFHPPRNFAYFDPSRSSLNSMLTSAANYDFSFRILEQFLLRWKSEFWIFWIFWIWIFSFFFGISNNFGKNRGISKQNFEAIFAEDAIRVQLVSLCP